MSVYLVVRVTEPAYSRALQALRFEIALATQYPTPEYSGDRINGMKRTLVYLETAGRNARRERAG